VRISGLEEPKPFVFFGERNPGVRLFTIGPEHLDWLCVFCGRTGGFDGDRVARWVLAMDHLSLGTALAEGLEVEGMFDRTGWELAKRRVWRSAIAHLQGHLRFDHIRGEDR